MWLNELIDIKNVWEKKLFERNNSNLVDNQELWKIKGYKLSNHMEQWTYLNHQENNISKTMVLKGD